MKTKVCYLITKGVWGGAQKYLYTLATELPKDEYEVVVITGAGNLLKEKLEEKGIKVYELPELKRDISLSSELESFKSIYKILKAEKPDVLHLNSPKASGLGALAGRMLFIKTIVQTVHGFTWNEERSHFSKILISFFSWVTMMLCHRTIVIAPQEEKEAKSLWFVKDSKIVLVRNGVEQINFKTREESRKQILPTWTSDVQVNGQSDIWIGTLSELHKNKGLEYAIDAVSKIPEPVKFIIIGEGEERENLQRLIDAKRMEDKIFLIGFMKNAAEYIKAFDIFTLTSLKEGLPYSILEAGRASLPVIASSVGGIPDIIENGVSGMLTTKGRIGEINRAMQYMIDNPEKRIEMAQNLNKKIEKEFSAEIMLEKTFELYR